MNIMELGALGEFVGAIAVVVTLIYLAIQVRHSASLLEHNNTAMEENTKLAQVAAMDRYSDSVSRWRGRLIEHEDVAALWHKAINDDEVEGIESVRLDNLYIDWNNTYRANFARANAIGDDVLARQAVMSVVPVIKKSETIRQLWLSGAPYNEAARDFREAVDAELSR